jgi:phage N-6-adenine-methyltransferase
MAAKTCPRCPASAEGREAVEAVFGFRRLNGKVIPQSWCRKCRAGGTMSLVDDRPPAGDRWATPRDLFMELHERFHYTVDLAAEASNALLPRYFTNGLHTSWEGERGWCCPPYSRIDPWIAKASEADLATFLLPVRTDRPWFSIIWDRREKCPHEGWTVDFPEGRVRFQGAATDPNWASMLCTYTAEGVPA